MAGNNIKLKKFLLRAVTVISIIVIVVVGGGSLFMRFYLEPRLGVKNSDVLKMTKYLTDGQLLANLKNFDKQAAKGVLEAMLELDEENQSAAVIEESVGDELLNNAIARETKNILKNNPKSAKEFATEKGVEVTKSQETAYDRIMAAATPEEIAAGMAIIAKVDLAKVSELQKEKTSVPLKKYIKSVLTSAEISKALSLYSKYKHLL